MLCAPFVAEGKITIGCNNETAIRIFDQEYIPSPEHKNFDLISACWKKKNATPIIWEAEHIKGHQDRFLPKHMLSSILDTPGVKFQRIPLSTRPPNRG
jgi:hypothetical protein